MYTNAATNNLFTGQVVGGEYVYPSGTQNAVIKFNSFYLSALDNDFADGGMSFSYLACDSDDITIGNAPAAVLNVTMLNPEGTMESLAWGEGTAYIGVATQSGTYTSIPTGTLIYCNYGGTTIRATASQFTCTIGGTNYTRSISGTTPLGIMVDDANNKAYLYTNYNVVECNLSTHAFTATTPSASFMVNKYRNMGGNTAVVVTSDGLPTGYTVTDTDARTASYNDFVYIPMGVVNFSSVEAAGISFGVEAYDRMTLFDADATDWVGTLDFSTPLDISDIISELMSEMGFTGHYSIDASAVNTSVQWSENPITSYAVTYRQVLKWLAEAIGCNARMSRTGDVEFVAYHSSPVGNTISCDTVVGNTRTKGKNAVPVITKVICYNTVGAGYEDGSDGSDYYVIANPFIDPSSDLAPVTALLGLLDDIPAYYPTTLGVMYSDPRIDAGDFISVNNTDNDPLNAYAIPVMSQIIFWDGVCRTEYVASGNQVRQIPDSLEGTGLSEVVSSNPAAVVNMIQAHGIDADWITAGTISDRNRNNTWDLDTGDLSITTGKIETTYTHTYDYTDYSASDITRIQQIIAGQITPTEADYEKYDTDGNGYIRVLDMVRIQAMIDNQENLTKTITTTIDPSANNKAIAIRVQIPAIGQAAAVDRYATYAVSQVNVNTATFVDLFASVANLSEILLKDVSGDIELGSGSILFSDTNNNIVVTMTASSLDYDDGSNNHTVIAPSGITFKDGTATPTMRVLRRTLSSNGNTTVTLENGVYLAIVSHQNNSSTSETGLYIIQCNNTSSILTIAAASNQTLSVSGHTLTWTTSNTYRQLRLIYLS